MRHGSIRFEAEVAGWNYREPDPLYGDFTTETWRRLYGYRTERPCGSDLYRMNGREIGGEAAFQMFLHDYKAYRISGIPAPAVGRLVLPPCGETSVTGAMGCARRSDRQLPHLQRPATH